jgi:ribonuclease BN (tRNA processing enzyme)
MKVTFWGVRGSLPAPLSTGEYRGKIRELLQAFLKAGVAESAGIEPFIDGLPFHLGHLHGGNSACVSVEDGDTVIILDAGTGIRQLGNRLAGRGVKECHLFLSHLHWDHVMGLPFFVPIYLPGTTIHLYSFQPEAVASITALFTPPAFPVPFAAVAPQLVFHHIELAETLRIGNLRCTFRAADHPNGCMNIRVATGDGTALVYATDSEYRELHHESVQEAVAFFRGADLLIFDAQYAFVDSYTAKFAWGHSSNLAGIDLAVAAGVKRLFFFHHDPAGQDADLELIRTQSLSYRDLQHRTPLEIAMAWEGQELQLG